MRAARRWVRLTRAGIAMTPQGRAATTASWTTYAKASRSSIGELGFVVGSGFVCLLVRGQTNLVLDQLPSTYAEATSSTTRVWGTGEIAAQRARRPGFDVEVLAADRVVPVTGLPHQSAPNILADLSAVRLLTFGR
ncbi:hypothetical protein [Nocardiopsis eucommiae]|uniref:hypothetical protein n=1 Tax=Nocardiopsis eucommiae TaxID=2831970 RepID=UPI003D723D7E